MPFFLESKFCYPTIINLQKLQKFLDHGNLELYGNDDLCSLLIGFCQLALNAKALDL